VVVHDHVGRHRGQQFAGVLRAPGVAIALRAALLGFGRVGEVGGGVGIDLVAQQHQRVDRRSLGTHVLQHRQRELVGRLPLERQARPATGRRQPAHRRAHGLPGPAPPPGQLAPVEHGSHLVLVGRGWLFLGPLGGDHLRGHRRLDKKGGHPLPQEVDDAQHHRCNPRRRGRVLRRRGFQLHQALLRVGNGSRYSGPLAVELQPQGAEREELAREALLQPAHPELAAPQGRDFRCHALLGKVLCRPLQGAALRRADPHELRIGHVAGRVPPLLEPEHELPGALGAGPELDHRPGQRRPGDAELVVGDLPVRGVGGKRRAVVAPAPAAVVALGIAHEVQQSRIDIPVGTLAEQEVHVPVPLGDEDVHQLVLLRVGPQAAQAMPGVDGAPGIEHLVLPAMAEHDREAEIARELRLREIDVFADPVREPLAQHQEVELAEHLDAGRPHEAGQPLVRGFAQVRMHPFAAVEQRHPVAHRAAAMHVVLVQLVAGEFALGPGDARGKAVQHLVECAR
jgi:hypothetical protein